MDNVRALPGSRVPTRDPEVSLVATLENLLDRAKAGELRSFIGTGFMADGCRLAIWCDLHNNVYEMLGSIAWLEHEYVNRKTAENA